MVKSVEGFYRDAKVERAKQLAEAEGSRVIVTSIHPETAVDLREAGVGESQAADLRHRVAAFREDWGRQETAGDGSLR